MWKEKLLRQRGLGNRLRTAEEPVVSISAIAQCSKSKSEIDPIIRLWKLYWLWRILQQVRIAHPCKHSRVGRTSAGGAEAPPPAKTSPPLNGSTGCNRMRQGTRGGSNRHRLTAKYLNTPERQVDRLRSSGPHHGIYSGDRPSHHRRRASRIVIGLLHGTEWFISPSNETLPCD